MLEIDISIFFILFHLLQIFWCVLSVVQFSGAFPPVIFSTSSWSHLQEYVEAATPMSIRVLLTFALLVELILLEVLRSMLAKKKAQVMSRGF